MLNYVRTIFIYSLLLILIFVSGSLYGFGLMGKTEGIQYEKRGNNLELYINDKIIINHNVNNPFITVGSGSGNLEMYRGNFDIDDKVIQKIPLSDCIVNRRTQNTLSVTFSNGGKNRVTAEFTEDNGRLIITFPEVNNNFNRIWMKFAASEDEQVFGLGEQFTYFNLRGHKFPIWTSEQGVGRNKNTYITRMSDKFDKAGGDYYSTYFPEPTFMSSEKYYLHVDNSGYMIFDFTDKNYHEIYMWNYPNKLIIQSEKTFIDLLEKLTGELGRQPVLPDWIYNGIVLGVQGGTEKILAKLNNALEKGVKVSGLWVQDWVGRRVTSFGSRLNWNWQVNNEMYPDLKNEIRKLNEKGIKFLGYINPYLVENSSLFNEAASLGYLALNKNGQVYLVDFGEFNGGVVDLTNENAIEWYKNVIKKNMIDLGMSGWMADFGEYLPTDIVLNSGEDPLLMHNKWPATWAQVNYEALQETNNIGNIVYFMRAGFTNSQKYSTLMWAGDQNVDWSLDDGLPSVIPAALSLGLIGHGLNHSDIGGFTSIYGVKRTKELFMRWAELATFSPVMRTHEGNRPAENWQFDSDNETLLHLAKMTKIHKILKPYLKDAVLENAERGIPVMRPLFLHYENDKESYNEQYEYLLGRDVLVAPVYAENVTEWPVYLPPDNWIHLFSGEEFKGGGLVVVSSPLGEPPVFYREGTKYSSIFEEISKIK